MNTYFGPRVGKKENFVPSMCVFLERRQKGTFGYREKQSLHNNDSKIKVRERTKQKEWTRETANNKQTHKAFSENSAIRASAISD